MGFRKDLEFLAGAVAHGYDPYQAMGDYQGLLDDRQATRQSRQQSLAQLLQQGAEWDMQGMDPGTVQSTLSGMGKAYGLGDKKMETLTGALEGYGGGAVLPDEEDRQVFEAQVKPFIDGLMGMTQYAEGPGGNADRAAIRKQMHARMAPYYAAQPEAKQVMDQLWDEYYELDVLESGDEDRWNAYQEALGGRPQAPGGGMGGVGDAVATAGGYYAPAKALANRLPGPQRRIPNLLLNRASAAKSGGLLGKIGNALTGGYGEGVKSLGSRGLSGLRGLVGGGGAAAPVPASVAPSGQQAGLSSLARSMGNPNFKTSGGVNLGFSPLGELVESFRGGSDIYNSENPTLAILDSLQQPARDPSVPWYKDNLAWRLHDALPVI